VRERRSTLLLATERPAMPFLNLTKSLVSLRPGPKTLNQYSIHARGSIFAGAIFSRQNHQAANSSSLCLIAHVNRRFELPISSVKVRRRVVIEKIWIKIPRPRNIAAAHHRDIIVHIDIIISNPLLLKYLAPDIGQFPTSVVLASKWEYQFASRHLFLDSSRPLCEPQI
jgi:hypothetical protein